MRSRPGATIDAVEAIYAGVEASKPHVWLESALPHLVACSGESLGGLAHSYYAVGSSENWKISQPIVFDSPPEVGHVVHESFARATPAYRENLLFAMGPVGTFSEIIGSDLSTLPTYGESSASVDLRDQIYLNSMNPDGFGILVNINLNQPRTLGPAEKRRFSMLAAHLAAAGRIVLGFVRNDLEGVAAILETSGKVAHVAPAHEGKVTALREHAKRIDHARGAMKKTDPEGALASWEALLAGRYSLVDRFESDGRRYVVAYVNEPGVVDPRGLSKSEAIVATWAARGHSDKLIAYELGVAAGTVSGLLARVFKKLSVRSRAEMVRVLRAPSDVVAANLPNGADILVFSAPDAKLTAPQLTAIEREIAVYVGKGLRNAEIAKRRRVSERTIAKQISRIYEKLAVSSRVELAKLFDA